MAGPVFRRFGPELMVASSLALVAISLACVFALGAEQHVLRLLAWMSAHETLGAVVFFVVYLLVVVFVLPGVVFTLGAGFLFGIVKGALLVVAGETVGGTIAFLAARHLFGAGLARFVARHPRLDLINERLGREGWKIVLLTRLVPFFPFKLSNYLFGLSRFSLPGFVLGTATGIIPNTLATVYMGSLAADLATLESRGATRSALDWAVYGVGLVIALAAVLYITRLASRALNDGGGADQ